MDMGGKNMQEAQAKAKEPPLPLPVCAHTPPDGVMYPVSLRTGLAAPDDVSARRHMKRQQSIATLGAMQFIGPLVEQVGPIDKWPPAALQLARKELHRQATMGNRYYCLATLLTNGANPESLAEFLVANGSIKHSESAVADTVNIMLKHKAGELTTTADSGYKEPMSIVMVACGAMQRYAPDEYDEEQHFVPIRSGILPGFDANGNACYEKTILDLERKIKGPLLDKKALRKRGRWDGVGWTQEHRPYAHRFMHTFQPDDLKACTMKNADNLSAHLIKHGGGPFWGAKSHDCAIYKLWISLGPGHKNFGAATQALKTIGKMRNYTEESRMKKLAADYDDACTRADQNLMHVK